MQEISLTNVTKYKTLGFLQIYLLKFLIVFNVFKNSKRINVKKH